MSTPNPSEPHQPDPDTKPTLQSKTHIQEPSDSPSDTSTTAPNQEKSAEDETLLENEEEEEEEEGECGFCLFMKGGGCKETFVEWEKCVEEGENNKQDIVEKCFQATAALKKCMEAHSDYYAPLLQAEKAAEEEAAKQLEEEKAKSSDHGSREEVKEESLDGLKD